MSTDTDHRSANARTGAAACSRSVRASTKGLRSPVARPSTPDLAAARDRLASLPAGFSDWVADAPPWPADLPEVIGPRTR